MTPHKKQYIVIVVWRKEKGELGDRDNDYYGPFSQSEAEVKVWMARFSNVNQEKLLSIKHKVLIKP